MAFYTKPFEAIKSNLKRDWDTMSKSIHANEGKSWEGIWNVAKDTYKGMGTNAVPIVTGKQIGRAHV